MIGRKKIDLGTLKEYFDTPIEINFDNEYYLDLECKYKEILATMDSCGINEDWVQEIKDIQENILNAIKEYYTGNLGPALESITIILDKLKDNPYVVQSVKSNMAFRDYMSFKKECKNVENYIEEEVAFFKARINDSENKLRVMDMFHIPFNYRGKVSTQRFSVPGLPCIYLGRSAYICWVELGKPADNIFNVSCVRLDNEIKIFSLATNIYKIERYLDGIKNKEIEKYNLDSEELIRVHFKLWMLSIATSYNINEKGRSFRSEYIISQLIMLYLKNNDIDGVAYYSKRIFEQSDSLQDLSVNVALFAKYDYEYNLNYDYSKICEKIKMTAPVNYGEFKQLSENIIYTPNKDNGNHLKFENNLKKIPLAGGLVSYNKTEFCRLEEHLMQIFPD